MRLALPGDSTAHSTICPRRPNARRAIATVASAHPSATTTTHTLAHRKLRSQEVNMLDRHRSMVRSSFRAGMTTPTAHEFALIPLMAFASSRAGSLRGAPL
jgi:hypothetical protein